MDRFYYPASSRDFRTLYQVRNLLKHKTIKKKVMDNVNYVLDLINVCTCGMVILAVTKIAGLAHQEDDPILSPTWEDEVKTQYLMEIASKIIPQELAPTPQNTSYGGGQ
jgi:hypothetical protein